MQVDLEVAVLLAPEQLLEEEGLHCWSQLGAGSAHPSRLQFVAEGLENLCLYFSELLHKPLGIAEGLLWRGVKDIVLVGDEALDHGVEDPDEGVVDELDAVEGEHDDRFPHGLVHLGEPSLA